MGMTWHDIDRIGWVEPNMNKSLAMRLKIRPTNFLRATVLHAALVLVLAFVVLLLALLLALDDLEVRARVR